MSEINPKFVKYIDHNLEQDLFNKNIITYEDSMWIVDLDQRTWFFYVTSNGTLHYNQNHFRYYNKLFSLTHKQFSKIITRWFENKFEIPIINFLRCSSEMNYMLDKILKSKHDNWEINKRFGFSYGVVKKFLKLKEQTKQVFVEDFVVIP